MRPLPKIRSSEADITQGYTSFITICYVRITAE